MIAQKTFSVKRAAKDGRAALTLHVTPSSFVFETDELGNIQPTTLNANKGSIMMFDGLNVVTPENITLKPYNCNAGVNGNVLSFESINPNQVCGKVEIKATYKGEERTTIVEFYVSKQRWNDSRFENTARELSSVKQRYESWQGRLDTLSSEIRQIPGQITLEVSRQTSGGTNLLKGASLRHERISLEQGKSHAVCIHETIKIRHADNRSHAGYPYLEVNVSGYNTDLYSSARFWAYLESGKTYTCSFYYKYMNRSGSDISLAVGYAGGYTDNAKKWLNGSGINPLHKDPTWHLYQKTYTIGESGYYLFAPALIRNGHVLFSEVQLEEGIKATSWKDPDIVESIERSGINIQKGRLELRSNNVVILNSKGEQTAVIDQDGNLVAGTLRTKDKGGGYICLHDNMQEYYKHGVNHPSRRIGYIGNDWVDQRLSDDGNVIWEMNERGIVHYQTPERWAHVSDTYITTMKDIRKFFLINQERTSNLIFNSSNHKRATLKEYVAARDVNGKIIASAGVTVETGQTNDGKLFYTSRFDGGLTFGGRFNLDNDKFSDPFTGLILATAPTHYYPFNNQSGQTAIPSEYTMLRKFYGVEDYYNVDFQRPVEWAYINIYESGRRLGSHRIFRNK